MVCDQDRAGEVRHLRYLCKRSGAEYALDWRDREGVDGAGQRIVRDSTTSRKSGDPCKHTFEELDGSNSNNRAENVARLKQRQNSGQAQLIARLPEQPRR